MNTITNKEVNEILSYTYIITMQTKTDRRLYLSMLAGKPQWTFVKGDACVWDDDKQAINFAKKWFKNFDKYTIREYSKEIEIR